MIIEWLNTNNGFVMAILTLVYVVATILICLFNYMSAKATKLQIEESNRQFMENSRAHIIPKIIELEGELMCLIFENVGNDIAKEVKIDVDEKWISKVEQTNTFPETAQKLRNLKSNQLFLSVGQKICYGLCVPGNGYDDFKIMGEEILKIHITYRTINRTYDELFEIPLNTYDYLVNQSDFVRLTKKQIKEEKNIVSELKNINKSLNK